jgi:signal peptidase II
MAWPSLIVVLLDQVSKLAIVYTLGLHESVPVIPGFFDLVHVRNRGMAFGFMNHSGSAVGFYFLIPATLVAIIVLLIWLVRLKKAQAPIALGLSLILGGAVGNLIDRIRFREVIDFFDFYLGSYHWPAFNVADSAITVGTFWVAFFLVFRQQSPSILKS